MGTVETLPNINLNTSNCVDPAVFHFRENSWKSIFKVSAITGKHFSTLGQSLIYAVPKGTENI